MGLPYKEGDIIYLRSGDLINIDVPFKYTSSNCAFSTDKSRKKAKL